MVRMLTGAGGEGNKFFFSHSYRECMVDIINSLSSCFLGVILFIYFYVGWNIVT